MVLAFHPSGDYEISDRYTLERLGGILGIEISEAYLAEYEGWNLALYKESVIEDDDFLCLKITQD